VRHVEAVMGTTVSFDLRAPDDPARASRAIADAVAWLHRVDNLLSTYRPDSALERWRRRQLTEEAAPPELTEVLALAEQYRRETGGRFDAAWRGDGTLDPTGMVKGWAAERASVLLSAAGYGDHCINAAGDVRTAGHPEPGRAWRVGVTHPLRAGKLIARVETGDRRWAVATSGLAERGAHIVDPRRRAPALLVAAATVVGPELARADAYATALVAAGAEARDLARRLDGAGWPSLVVGADGQVWTSASWSGWLAADGVDPVLPGR
jgi:thiamine biosynthesis lipoprotein